MWPPRSSDLTACDIILWVGAKNKIKSFEEKMNGTVAAGPFDFVRSMGRILGHVLKFGKNL